VDAAAVRFPAGKRSRPAVVRVGEIQPAVVLLLELVSRRLGKGVAMLPKSLDEDVPFLVGLELAEDLSLVGRDDVDGFFIQPFFIAFGKGIF